MFQPGCMMNKIKRSKVNRASQECDSFRFRKISAEIASLISENAVTKAAYLLRKLLQQIVRTHEEANKIKQKQLRDRAYRLFHRIKTQKIETEIANYNFFAVTEFLRGKFSRKGRRGRALSSINTYFIQLLGASKFANEMGKKFIDLSIEDLRVFVKKYPSSIRILKELIRAHQSETTADNTNIDFEDPSLLRKKNRQPVSIFFLDTSNQGYQDLSKNERLVLILAAELFMRESEIARLKAKDIILDSPLPGLNVVGKGVKKRFVPLIYSSVAYDLIKNSIPSGDDDYLVCKSNGNRYSKRGINSICVRALGKMGLPGTHIHFLRHIGITKAILSGQPLKDVSAMAGHAHKKTTIEEYFHAQAYCILNFFKKQNILNFLFDFNPKLLSTKEAAEMLQIGIRNMQLIAKNEKIKTYKVKGQWLFIESDLLSHKLEAA